jgi:hypothetical protein
MDSTFKAPRVATAIIGRYPNFADLPLWIRRVSLRIMSESTLNMSASEPLDLQMQLLLQQVFERKNQRLPTVARDSDRHVSAYQNGPH